MDFHITWQKCLAYQDDVSRERTTPLSQRSRSHRQFKCKNATICVQSVILLCMEGFWNSLAQVFGISRQHVTRKNHAPISKVKVTLAVSVFACMLSFPGCNSLMYWRILKWFGTVFSISRWCVVQKNTPILKVKVTHLAWLLICNHSCLVCNSLMHERILKYFRTSFWHIKTMCCKEEPISKVKDILAGSVLVCMLSFPGCNSLMHWRM